MRARVAPPAGGIPVEPLCEERLAAGGLADPVRPFERHAGLTVLALAPEGECVFFERARGERPALCAVHRTLGSAALPSACRHFPRVAVTDDGGTFVTLSHFCPTAASLLFRDDVPLAVVEAPAAFHSVDAYEGLDARGTLPPLLRAGMLMDLDGHHAWERHVVAVLGDARHSAESAIAQIARHAEDVRTWKPGGRSLAAHIERIGRCAGTEAPAPAAREDQARTEGSPREPGAAAAAAAAAVVPVRRLDGADGELQALNEVARACVLPGLSWQPTPPELASVDRTWVAPVRNAFAQPVRRYLASKAFGSWIPVARRRHQNRGHGVASGTGRAARRVGTSVRGRPTRARPRAAGRGDSAGGPVAGPPGVSEWAH